MSATLGGRTAFITGATGAIARACAEVLARDGARLMLMGRRPEALAAAAGAIRAAVPGAEIATFAGDCTDGPAVAEGLARAHAMAGRLDIAFATVGGGGFKPLMMIEAQDLRADFESNVVSAFHVIRHGAPLMGRGGSIVCLSSGSAVLTFPYLATYHVAKAALEGLVRSAADELGSAGIRVNAIRPGMTRSGGTGPMFDSGASAAFLPEYPLGRLGEPGDMAGAVRFLAGPESAWVTGQCIAVDGGNLLRRSPDLTAMVEHVFGAEAMAAARDGKEAPQ
ncbi:MAG: SDR family oxidoreductase [Sphingomonadales bacterium]|nr:SDR family oxidoreductase [Sphingomonadales bacterium]